MEKNIQDKDLGVITLRTTPRATRYTLKISKGKDNRHDATGGDEKRMIAFIMENKARLVKALQKYPAGPCSTKDRSYRLRHSACISSAPSEVISTWDWRMGYCISLVRMRLVSKRKRCNPYWKSMLEKALRHEAKRLLPERITLLARQHGFMLTGVKINNSKTHWGSCTMKKSINLSQSLMLLPWHLVNYVLLHELCHTIEMNHSERFWKLMDKVTDNQAIRLRNELKSYHML